MLPEKGWSNNSSLITRFESRMGRRNRVHFLLWNTVGWNIGQRNYSSWELVQMPEKFTKLHVCPGLAGDVWVARSYGVCQAVLFVGNVTATETGCHKALGSCWCTWRAASTSWRGPKPLLFQRPSLLAPWHLRVPGTCALALHPMASFPHVC